MVFTLFQAVVDAAHDYYSISVGAVSTTDEENGSSLFHISYNRGNISVDLLWIGGILHLLGVN